MDGRMFSYYRHILRGTLGSLPLPFSPSASWLMWDEEIFPTHSAAVTEHFVTNPETIGSTDYGKKPKQQRENMSPGSQFIEGRQGRNSDMARIWAQGLMKKPQSSAALQLAPHGLLTLFSYRTKDKSGGSAINSELGPYQPVINKVTYRADYG